MYKNKKTNIFYLRALYMCITILPKIEDSDTLGNPIEIKKKQINFYASTWDRKNWLDERVVKISPLPHAWQIHYVILLFSVTKHKL